MATTHLQCVLEIAQDLGIPVSIHGLEGRDLDVYVGPNAKLLARAFRDHLVSEGKHTELLHRYNGDVWGFVLDYDRRVVDEVDFVAQYTWRGVPLARDVPVASNDTGIPMDPWIDYVREVVLPGLSGRKRTSQSVELISTSNDDSSIESARERIASAGADLLGSADVIPTSAEWWSRRTRVQLSNAEPASAAVGVRGHALSIVQPSCLLVRLDDESYATQTSSAVAAQVPVWNTVVARSSKDLLAELYRRRRRFDLVVAANTSVRGKIPGITAAAVLGRLASTSHGAWLVTVELLIRLCSPR